MTDKIRPFLKWAGGKYRVLDELVSVLPRGKRLVEPFAGSGVVFLNTDYSRYLIADSNPDLIGLYQQLQEEGEPFIRYCRRFFTAANNTESAYYALRERFNRSRSRRVRAALFVYLNRHGYNGLCRYNSQGQFNVPFGRYARPYYPQEELYQFYQKSKRATFRCADFRQVMSECRAGDVYYLDPPYVPISKTANFTTYATGGFNFEDQRDLADAARTIRKNKVSVVISNHDTKAVRRLYAGAKITSIKVSRSISCNGSDRSQAKEVIACFS